MTVATTLIRNNAESAVFSSSFVREPVADVADCPIVHNSDLSPSFEPKQYLEKYFLDLHEEYEQLYRFWVWSSTYLKPGAIALEVGVGPTLYSTFPLVKSCREIHLANYVTDSFIETRKWLTDQLNAFDWTPHIDLVLQTEAAIYHDELSQKTTISQRAAATRSAVTQLLKCDVRQTNPLHIAGRPQQGALPEYDVVTAHYCTEIASRNQPEWREAIANLVSLVKPGGYFFLSVCTKLQRCQQYANHDFVQLSPDIDATLITRTLAEFGLDMDTLWLEEIPAPNGYPYASTVLVSIQKP